MIKKWKVVNFKSIREETELDFAPLTIFAGANSSGKSTFIQTILLVAQTLSHKVGSRSVVLNGALTSLGQFDDLKSNGSALDQIIIKCTCQPIQDQQDAVISRRAQFTTRSIYYRPRLNTPQEIACEISFDAGDSGSHQRDLFQIQPRLFSTRLSCISRDEENVDQSAGISVHYSSKSKDKYGTVEINDQLRESLDYAVELDEASMAEVHDELSSAKPIGCVLRHFLPDIIVYVIETITEDANAITMALQDGPRRHIRFRRKMRKEIILSEKIIAVLREVLEEKIGVDQTSKDKNWLESLIGSESSLTFEEWYGRLENLTSDERQLVIQTLGECENLFERIQAAMKTESKESHAFVPDKPRLITDANRYLDLFFASSLKYLGPLRDAPKTLYPLMPTADPRDIGIRGEHTASILDLHKDKKIRFIPPANFKSSVIDRNPTTRTLKAAVMDWLQYLGVASSVKSQDRGKLGHELKVGLTDSEITHDLTHVGVGVSQVLPILVMCLLADTDSTLIFEQPELHLHPKVQTLLADFFLSMALCNKQCIVETHSEYFIDRLRFRIAAATPENELNSQTKVYFVENKLSRGSTFKEVEINEYGAILDWPEGFFDQSQQQAEGILRAAAMKRKNSRRKSDEQANQRND